MQTKNQGLLRESKPLLITAGLALKWLLIGCLAFVFAGLAMPWIASVVEGVRYVSGLYDFAFVLIGGLVGAGLGRWLGGVRAGSATLILTLLVAAGLYLLQGSVTPEECRRGWEARDRIRKQQAQILVRWGECLMDEERCDRLSDMIADLSSPGTDDRPGAMLDRLRRRELDRTAWLREKCTGAVPSMTR